jgi:hypothetical protein
MVVLLALILSSSNLYGYIRCKLGGNFKSVLTQYVGKQIFYNVSDINGKLNLICPNLSRKII